MSMMKQQYDAQLAEQRRKANRRVALILGLIALATMAYPFFFLPHLFAGGAGG